MQDVFKFVDKLNFKFVESNKAYYSLTTDTVVMPPLKSYPSIRGYYSTLFHELVHWTGHRSRLNRCIVYSKDTIEHDKEELIAGLGSLELMGAVGLMDVPFIPANSVCFVDFKTVWNDDDAAADSIVKSSEAAKYLLEKGEWEG